MDSKLCIKLIRKAILIFIFGYIIRYFIFLLKDINILDITSEYLTINNFAFISFLIFYISSVFSNYMSFTLDFIYNKDIYLYISKLKTLITGEKMTLGLKSRDEDFNIPKNNAKMHISFMDNNSTNNSDSSFPDYTLDNSWTDSSHFSSWYSDSAKDPSLGYQNTLNYTSNTNNTGPVYNHSLASNTIIGRNGYRNFMFRGYEEVYDRMRYWHEKRFSDDLWHQNLCHEVASRYPSLTDGEIKGIIHFNKNVLNLLYRVSEADKELRETLSALAFLRDGNTNDMSTMLTHVSNSEYEPRYPQMKNYNLYKLIDAGIIDRDIPVLENMEELTWLAQENIRARKLLQFELAAYYKVHLASIDQIENPRRYGVKTRFIMSSWYTHLVLKNVDQEIIDSVALHNIEGRGHILYPGKWLGEGRTTGRTSMQVIRKIDVLVHPEALRPLGSSIWIDESRDPLHSRVRAMYKPRVGLYVPHKSVRITHFLSVKEDQPVVKVKSLIKW